jgi:hypothetical protein
MSGHLKAPPLYYKTIIHKGNRQDKYNREEIDSRVRGNDIKRSGNDIKRSGNDIKRSGNDIK